MERLYIHGINAISEALESNHSIEKIWVSKDYHHWHLSSLLQRARKSQIPIQYVPKQRLFKLSTHSKTKIVALGSPIQYVSFEKLLAQLLHERLDFVFLMLDGVTNIRNFGAIVRTAVATSISAIIISNHHSVGITSDVISTSSGGIFKIPIVRVNHLKDVLYQLIDRKIPIIGLDEKSPHSIFETSFKKPLAIVAGDEHKGISKGVKQLVTHLVHLPMAKQMSSLNVSIACGITLYHINQHPLG
ncbi:MAG: 23S rRNA (guanosine(2251)-2'-O)-methyltransferase RlmB [Flavobacteriaceae bacterium]|nr:23S rRNA (guanosine(2251)-2'-O)-methyltransferase RlmB [Flavobacteriaceae bacterium]MCY4216320.1 23S rRNA (guanosine(2251)-2'-O)-methyltransferase RlmB [Flavobacteriaceae bacterium]MCY4253312.1 23S rRNA (guanosine(2251)-2'-O)-methyltransferase RlmB [Flavobacteriaceae bacterium]